MIERAELSALAKSVKAVIRESLVAIGERIDALEKRFTDIPAGQKGEPGKDVDPEAVRALVAFEVLKAIAQLPIPVAGAKGQDGKDADPELLRLSVHAEVERAVGAMPKPKDGDHGRPGKDAEPIHPDTISLMVAREVEKAVAAIPKAIDGRDGTPGRDALQIDPLPTIDPTKSYPRGTYAEYAGGTIRSVRNTEPITTTLQAAGWSVVSDGEADFSVTRGDDLRTFTFRKTLTSGRSFEFSFKMPVVIGRGIFKDGTEYFMGDSVVWDNSTWTCQAEATKAKPGTSPDWLMSARKGGNGKDGVTGPEGKPGKDLTAPNNGRKW